MERSELLRRAGASYERGRLLKAVRTAALVLPITFVSFGCCGDRRATLAIAGVLVAVVVAVVWRGGAGGRGVVPGLVAGAVALAIPLFACPLCAGAGVAPFVACVAGGLASGAVVVSYATREQGHRGPFVLAAGAVAALAGSLGCVVVGLGGVAAMVAGVALVAPLGVRGISRTPG